MKKTPIASMTDDQIRDEIAFYRRRPFNGAAKWAMRLFDLCKELEDRRKTAHYETGKSQSRV